MSLAAEERDWLLAILRQLVGRMGPGPLVALPILTPGPQVFPDQLDQGLVGLTTLIRRLAQYAGMGDVELRVTEHLDEDPEEEPSPVRFVGIEAGVLGFEVLEYRPWDQMVDALVFEVAAAYRCFHALDTEGSPYRDSIAIGDADAWADCVGVTACFLGMGVLAANAADRFQTNGHLSGGWVHTEWRHDLRGSLTQEMLTWLLSVITTVRGCSSQEVGRLAKHLGANQRASFRRARRGLGERRAEFIEHLGLPPEETWPAPRPLVAKPLPPSRTTQESSTGDVSADAEVAPTPIAYRVPLGSGIAHVPAGLLLGLLVGSCVWVKWGQLSLFLGAVILGTAFPLVRRRMQARVQCSSSDCLGINPDGADRCSSCGRLFAGNVSSRHEALDLPTQRVEGLPRTGREPESRRG